MGCRAGSQHLKSRGAPALFVHSSEMQSIHMRWPVSIQHPLDLQQLGNAQSQLRGIGQKLFQKIHASFAHLKRAKCQCETCNLATNGHPNFCGCSSVAAFSFMPRMFSQPRVQRAVFEECAGSFHDGIRHCTGSVVDLPSGCKGTDEICRGNHTRAPTLLTSTDQRKPRLCASTGGRSA